MTGNSALEVTSITDAGVVRSFDEDAIATELDLGLVVVADGMGGYKAGDVASNMATAIVVEVLKSSVSTNGEFLGEPVGELRRAVEKANRAICQAAQASPQYHGMGTTVVAALFLGDKLYFTHVGDSRLYRLRLGKLTALTQDHSILHEQVALGLISTDEAKMSHNRNLVTRALGVDPAIEVEVRQEGVEPGDIYLLCSDGLNDMVDDADIELAIGALQANLPLAAQQLVMMANDNGGHDNVSVILVKVVNVFAGRKRPAGLWARLAGWFR